MSEKIFDMNPDSATPFAKGVDAGLKIHDELMAKVNQPLYDELKKVPVVMTESLPVPSEENFKIAEDNLTSSLRGNTVLSYLDKTSPQEAAKLFQNAQRLNIEKNIAKYADLTAPEIEFQMQRYKNNPVVADYLAGKDPDYVSLMRDSIENLQHASGLMAMVNKNFTTPIKSGYFTDRMGVLGLKKMNEGLTSDEEAELKEYSTFSKLYKAGEGWSPKAFIQQAGVLAGQMGPGLAEGGKNALIASGTVAGTSLALGAPTAGVSILGMPITTGAAFSGGFTYGMAKHTYEVETGQAWLNYNEQKDSNGKPLSPEIMKAMAMTAGTINAGLEFGGVAALKKLMQVPGISAFAKLGKDGIRKAILKETLSNPTFRDSILHITGNYIKGSVGEILTEGAQEVSPVMGGYFAKKISDKINGTNFDPNIKDTAAELGYNILEVMKATFQGTAVLGLPPAGYHGAKAYKEYKDFKGNTENKDTPEFQDKAKSNRVTEFAEPTTLENIKATYNAFQAAPVAKSNPEVLKDYINTTAKKRGEEDFRIEGDDAMMLFQMDSNVAEAFAEIGIDEEAIAKAVGELGYIKITPGALYSMKPEAFNVLYEKVRNENNVTVLDAAKQDGSEHRTKFLFTHGKTMEKVSEFNKALDEFKAGLPKGYSKEYADISVEALKAYVLNLTNEGLHDDPAKFIRETYFSSPEQFDAAVKNAAAVQKAQPLSVEDIAVTPQGSGKVKFKYKIVDADSVKTSDHVDYLQGLQPRNRADNVNSSEQIVKIANEGGSLLKAGRSNDTANGAPLVDNNGNVVSGNARVMGFRQSYDKGTMSDYRRELDNLAANLGISAQLQGKSKPVLVREISESNLDLPEIAKLSNMNNILQYSSEEQAVSDADIILKNNLLSELEVSETGDINNKKNSDFLNNFIHYTGANELKTTNGAFIDNAFVRVKNALLAAYFKDTPNGNDLTANLIRASQSSEGLSVKTQTDGLLGVIGKLIKLERSYSEFGLSQDIAGAMQHILSMKSGNFTADAYLKQADLFTGETPIQADSAEDIIFKTMTAGNYTTLEGRQTAKGIRDFFNTYIKAVEKHNPNAASLGIVEDKKKLDLLKASLKELRNEDLLARYEEIEYNDNNIKGQDNESDTRTETADINGNRPAADSETTGDASGRNGQGGHASANESELSGEKRTSKGNSAADLGTSERTDNNLPDSQVSGESTGMGRQPADRGTGETVSEPADIELVSNDADVDIAEADIELGNYSLNGAAALNMGRAERRDVNGKCRELLNKPADQLTEADKNLLRLYTGEGGLSSGTVEALNQHYTGYETTSAVFNTIDNIDGFTYNKVLEPAGGVGNFVGMRPEKNWTTVELDNTSHEILKRLYPAAENYNISFEDFKTKGFDLIASNVPFLEMRPGLSQNRPEIKALHDFYFVHALELVKDNGIIAFITSSGTMDKKNSAIRSEIVSKADVIGAFRLPGGHFKANAHTDVITDVIFLQKRPDGIQARTENKTLNDAFINSTETADGINLNGYYQAKPENVLGDLTAGINKMYGGRPAYEVNGTADLSRMKVDWKAYEAVSVSKQDTETSAIHENTAIPERLSDFLSFVKNNNLEYRLNTDANSSQGVFIKDGRVFAVDKEIEFTDVECKARLYKEISGVTASKIKLLDQIAGYGAAFQISKKQADSDNGIIAIAEYQKKYKKHPSKDKDLKKLFKDSKDESYLLELGSYFDKDFNPAKVFSEQTRHTDSGVADVTTASDVKIRAFASENKDGIIDLNNAGHVTKDDLSRLLHSGYSVLEYSDKKALLQNDILYYSGKIYEKLEKLDTVKLPDNLAYKIDEQRTWLMSVLPPAVTLDELNIKGSEGCIFPIIKKYNLAPITVIQNTKTGKSEFKYGRSKVYEKFLNNRQLVNREKNWDDSEEPVSSFMHKVEAAEEELRVEQNWIKEQIRSNPAALQEIETAFNKTFKGFVKPDYSQAGYLIQDVLDEVEKNGLKLRKNQVEWILQSVYEGKGINSHDVGGGKTLAAVVLARVLKRKGMAKKPMFVVPAKTIKNWEKEIKRAFPDAKILNLGRLDASERTERLFELANSNVDYVLISHEGFGKVQLPADVEAQYIDELLNENFINNETDKKSKRDDAKELLKAEQYKQALLAENRDTRLTFDKLGVDSVVVDEAHNFKNIGVRAELTKFALGIPFSFNLSETTGKVTLSSDRSYDMRFKCNYISDDNNGNNVFLLTATPTPNKPMEIYTMLKHLDKNIFHEYGIKSDKDFADMFFSLGTAPKMNDSNKTVNILKAIINAISLKSIIRRFLDKLSMEMMPWITVPKENPIFHHFDPSGELDEISMDLNRRQMAVKGKRKAEKGEDNIISVFTAGRSASVDPRLYGGEHAQVSHDTRSYDPMTDKIEFTIQNVIKVHKEDKKAGQLIFLDSAGQSRVDSGELNENIHIEIKNELIKKGFKASEIAIINGQVLTNPATGKETKSGDKDALKQAIVEAYNSGVVKVVIGTTQSMGEGMNLQVTTTDIYHVDIPYTPGAIRQRNGRGVRFGNNNKTVRTHMMLTRGTFDAISYSIVANKKGWNEALYSDSSDDTIDVKEEMSGGGTPSQAQMLIAMEKDPENKAKLILMTTLNSLMKLRTASGDGSRITQARIAKLHEDIQDYQESIADRSEKLKTIKEDKTIKDIKQRKEAFENRKLSHSRSIETYTRKITESETRIQKLSEQLESLKNDYDNAALEIDAFRKKYEDEKTKDIIVPKKDIDSIIQTYDAQFEPKTEQKTDADSNVLYQREKDSEKTVRDAYEFALNGTPVANLTGKEFQKDGIPLTDKVTEFYKKEYNGVVENPDIGPVELDREGVKDSLGHGVGSLKAAAYAAVPHIIKDGKIFDRQKNWKGRGYGTVVIIAPITISGEHYVGEVIVKQGTKRQGFYLHEVELKEKLQQAFKTANGSASGASKLIIAQKLKDVNTFNQKASKGIKGLTVEKQGKHLIQLSETADASTLIHELTHGFVNDMIRFISGGYATARMKEDFAKAMYWAGLRKTITDADGKTKEVAMEYNDLSNEQKIEFNEKFAVGNEMYLREGKAPKEELLHVFRQFRGWMLVVYKYLNRMKAVMSDGTGREVKLTGEMRLVLARLYATDAEISEVKQGTGFDAMTKAVLREEGHTEEQIQELEKFQNEMFVKTASKSYEKKVSVKGASYKELYNAAKKTFQDDPVQALISFVRKNGGLNRDYISDELGQRYLITLHRKGLIANINEEGLDPVTESMRHGYDSVKDMCDFLMDAPTRQDFLDNYIMNKAAELDNNAVSTQEELISSAEYSEVLESLGAPYRKLIERLYKKSVKAQAEEDIQNTNVKDINAVKYLKNFKRAMEDKVKAVGKKNKEKAAKAHREAMYWREMILIAYKIKDMVRVMNEDVTAASKLVANKLDEDYLLNIKYLADRFNIVKFANLDLKKRISIYELLKDGGGSLPGHLIGETAQPDGSVYMSELQQNDYRNLSYADFVELHSILEQLIGKGKDIIDGEIANGKMRIQEALKIMTESAGKLKDKPIWREGTVFGDFMRDKTKLAREYMAAMTMGRFLLRKLDNFDAAGKHVTGIFETAIYNPLAKGHNKYLGLQDKTRELLKAPLLALIKSKKKFSKALDTDVRVSNAMKTENIVWTFERVVCIALNCGNSYNEKAVMDGYELSETAMDKLLSILTIEDWQNIQKIWDGINTLWPENAKVHKELDYRTPKKVEAEKFTRKVGDKEIELAGGYYPLKWDAKLDDTGTIENEHELSDLILSSDSPGIIKPRASDSHNIARRGTGGRPVLLDLNVLTQHIDQTCRYIALAKPIRDADRLMKGKYLDDFGIPVASMRQLVVQKLGQAAHDSFVPWLKNIANQIDVQSTRDPIDKGLNKLRPFVSVWALGMNAKTAMFQPLSVCDFAHDEGIGTAFNGVLHVLKNPILAYNLMCELSPTMKNRMANLDAEIKGLDSASFWNKARGYVTYGMIQVMDMVVACPAWWGVYNREMNNSNGDPEAAIIKANEAVANAFGSSRTLDKNGFQNSKLAARLFTMFSSYGCIQANNNIELYNAMMSGKLSIYDTARFIMIRNVVPAFLSGVVLSLLQGKDLSGGDDDDDPWKQIFINVALYPFQGFIGIRDIAFGIQSLIGGGKYTNSRTSPLFDVPISIVKKGGIPAYEKGYEVYNDLFNGIYNEKASEKTTEKLMWAFADGICFGAKVPLSKVINKWTEGMKQIEDGDGVLTNLLFPDYDEARKHKNK